MQLEGSTERKPTGNDCRLRFDACIYHPRHFREPAPGIHKAVQRLHVQSHRDAGPDGDQPDRYRHASRQRHEGKNLERCRPMPAAGQCQREWQCREYHPGNQGVGTTGYRVAAERHEREGAQERRAQDELGEKARVDVHHVRHALDFLSFSSVASMRASSSSERSLFEPNRPTTASAAEPAKNVLTTRSMALRRARLRASTGR